MSNIGGHYEAFPNPPEPTAPNDRRVSALAEHKVPFSGAAQCKCLLCQDRNQYCPAMPLLSATEGAVSGNVSVAGCKWSLKNPPSHVPKKNTDQRKNYLSSISLNSNLGEHLTACQRFTLFVLVFVHWLPWRILDSSLSVQEQKPTAGFAWKVTLWPSDGYFLC